MINGQAAFTCSTEILVSSRNSQAVNVAWLKYTPDLHAYFYRGGMVLLVN